MRKIILKVLIMSFLIWPIQSTTYALDINDTSYWFDSAGDNLLQLSRSDYMLSNVGVDEGLNRYVIAQQGGKIAYLLKINEKGSLLYAKLIPPIDGYVFDNANYINNSQKQTFKVIYKNGYVYVMSTLIKEGYNTTRMAYYKIRTSNGTVMKKSSTLNPKKQMKNLRFDDVIDDCFLYRYQKDYAGHWYSVYRSYDINTNKLYQVLNNGARDDDIFYFKVHKTTTEFMIESHLKYNDCCVYLHNDPQVDDGRVDTRKVASFVELSDFDTSAFVKLTNGKERWFITDNNDDDSSSYISYKEASTSDPMNSFLKNKVDIPYRKGFRSFEYAANNKMVLYGQESPSQIKATYYDLNLNKLQEFELSGLSSRERDVFISGSKVYLNEKKFVLRDVIDNVVDLNTYIMKSEPKIVINNPTLNKIFKNNQSIIIEGTVQDSDDETVIIKASIGGSLKTTTVDNTSSPKGWTLQWGTNEVAEGTYTDIEFTAENE